MSSGLDISLEEINRKTVLRLEGRLDAATTPQLERKIETLIHEGHLYLLLDFSHISYLSSAGMRLILSASKKLKGKNGFLVLFAVGGEVFEVIRWAGFDKLIPIFETEREALQR